MEPDPARAKGPIWSRDLSDRPGETGEFTGNRRDGMQMIWRTGMGDLGRLQRFEGGPVNVGSWHQAGYQDKLRAPEHNTPFAPNSLISASLRPSWPRTSALCWPSFGATVRTRTLSPILIGFRPVPRRWRIGPCRGGGP